MILGLDASIVKKKKKGGIRSFTMHKLENVFKTSCVGSVPNLLIR